ncbi:tetratricopeptide repeat protein 17-like [Diaphorina citri]|uniref:Tetratricopeptide repeat protein 17-like n=1 Tax=Diaphorina citri TaxID=121845 RepID=A0A1S4EGE5_DIACI|nr:tetratricopeptide repeat protein 17-like [Diaphorina citri]
MYILMLDCSCNDTDKKDLKSLDSDGDETFLNCGKSVNLTYFDSLLGISNRANHPNVEETKVLLIQHKNFTQAQMRDFCSKLKKEIRVMPKSLERNIRIGNFWRYKGDTKKAVECFRKVLSVSPNNSEVLLYLARVLLNLQYLDDASYLTRRSIEVLPAETSAWQHYFTLGEIFKVGRKFPRCTHML